MTQDFGKVEVEIPCGDLTLNGTLSLPIEPHGMILFAHGSGSSRFSTRNQFVANVLNKGNFATLLLDLLHPNEDQTSAARFDIDLLTNRLWHAFIWSKNYQKTRSLPIGLFGASTGAAATLQLAGNLQLEARDDIFAIVSRGGRPDLARAEYLKQVRAPCLFVVGQNDEDVIALNKIAYSQMTCYRSFQIIRGASHLFEEPGKLILVANLALSWYQRYVISNPEISKSFQAGA
jgi:pimeloyl-ACP methyl ester carboxylesterase